MKSERERAEDLLEKLHEVAAAADQPYLEEDADKIRMHYFVALHLIEDALGESIEDSDLVRDLRAEIEDLEMQLEHEQECQGTCEGEDAL